MFVFFLFTYSQQLKNRSSEIYQNKCLILLIHTFTLMSFQSCQMTFTKYSQCLQSSHFDHHIISSTEIITLKCYLPSSLHVCLLGTWNNPPLEIILARPRESSPLSKSLRQCLYLSVSPNANQDVMFGWYGKKTA